MSAVNELYQEVILDHNRSPRNYRPMPDATKSVEGFNPLCGDHYTIHVKMQENVLADVSFEGAGCAISKASASVMSSEVKGKTKEEAERLFREFHDLVTGKAVVDEGFERYGRLAAFAGVSEFPARVKCASLAWHTLHSALTSDDPRVTTE